METTSGANGPAAAAGGELVVTSPEQVSRDIARARAKVPGDEALDDTALATTAADAAADGAGKVVTRAEAGSEGAARSNMNFIVDWLWKVLLPLMGARRRPPGRFGVGCRRRSRCRR